MTGATVRSRRLLSGCAALAVVMIAGAIAQGVAARQNAGWLRLMWVKGQYEARPIVERWNSFSRIRVIGNPERAIRPSGWGFSSTLPPERTAHELHLDIDSYAGTELTAYHGEPETVAHLKYDVTNVVHYLRPDSRVVVVGTGGGRDVLSALAFDQKQVTGVEINEGIIDLVNRRFGDFTGHLDRDPRVQFVNDEARSYLARRRDRVDIIQISLIDTWAATASGAFVLTENSLYTVDAWRIFLDRLAPRGILSVSRWYYADRPGEVYRLATLASGTLMQMGITGPAIITPSSAPGQLQRLMRLMVSGRCSCPAIRCRPQDLDVLESVASKMHFEIVQSPRYSADETFAAIASAERLHDAVARHPLNISPPTDDTPFFFHMLRLRDVFNTARWHDQGIVRFNMTAVGVLGVLMLTVTVLTAACIAVPLWYARSKERVLQTVAAGSPASSDTGSRQSGIAAHLLFFAAIGFGFMLVEISQVQRLTIFLGHPVYSLSVVLFSLLLSSGLGSMSTGLVHVDRERWPLVLLAVLVMVLIAFGAVTPMRDSAVRSGFNADPDRDRSVDLVADWLFHGHGVSDWDAARAGHRTVDCSVALGGERGRLGLRVGARRGHRDRRRHFNGFLGWDGVLRRSGCGLL